jgi:hypothetical protein
LSYDLQVFAQQAVGVEELRRLITDAGLAVDGAGAGALTIVRSARAQYSFTLGLPVACEAEDVPEQVTGVLLGAAYVYELTVEGSSTIETPHAVRFARRLAQASAGVVLDQQTGEVWARGWLRRPPPVQRGTIDVVQCRWYVRPGGTGAAAAEAWLELARRHLPEALPRRFGPTEPLSMKLDEAGPDAFARVVADEAMSVYYKASAPCIEGSVAGGSGGPGVHSHGLSVHRAALTDPQWRVALQHLFVGFADAVEAVFASAEVQRGVGWSGRGTWYEADTERTNYLAAGGHWAGPTPYPVWWSWFGPDYLPLVVDHLPAERVRRIGGGVFHAGGEAPLDRDQLTAAPGTPTPVPAARRSLRDVFARTAGRAPAAPWLPAELLPTVVEGDLPVFNPPLTAAVTMPAALGPEG